MRVEYILLVIGLMCLVTFLTRAIPFYSIEIFKDHPFVKYLAQRMPPAVMIILVIFCYRNINYKLNPHGIPDLIAGLLTVAVHLYKRNLILSLITGILFYAIIYWAMS